MSLTRKDLRDFDRHAQDLILEAQSLGLYVKVSRRGHAIFRSQNGATTALGKKQNSRGRTSQNSRAGVRKVIADHCGS